VIQFEHGEIVWFQFASLRNLGDLITHGVFGRLGGVSQPPFSSLNAGPATPDDAAARAENYRRIRETLPGQPLLVGTKPLQGTTVYEVTERDVEGGAPPAVILPEGCDAFITRTPGIGLFWAVADCSAIMIVDPIHQAVGLTHAGWRGTRGGIVRNTLERMRERYGTQPDQVYTAISPTISTCCYEVDERVRDEFAQNPFAERNARFSTVTVSDAVGARESLRLDVLGSNRAQLLDLGIPAERIEISELCTGSRTDLFFSSRMEGGRTGRFAVVLGLR